LVNLVIEVFKNVTVTKSLAMAPLAEYNKYDKILFMVCVCLLRAAAVACKRHTVWTISYCT
jgi:hypothetical protein